MSRVIDALRRHQRTGRTPDRRSSANHPTLVLEMLCPKKRGFFDWHVALIAPLVIIVGTLIWLLLGE